MPPRTGLQILDNALNVVFSGNHLKLQCLPSGESRLCLGT